MLSPAVIILIESAHVDVRGSNGHEGDQERIEIVEQCLGCCRGLQVSDDLAQRPGRRDTVEQEELVGVL